MKIAMIGGGGVAQTLASAFLAQGHEVVIGIRAVTPEELTKARNFAKPLAEWQAETKGRVVTMEEAAAFGTVIFNVTQGAASIAALKRAGAHLDGKVLVDVANPLDFSAGMPAFLARDYAGPTSLGEAIQAAFPKARVVKAFNTIAAAVMVNPGLIPGTHDLFLAGNDAAAKAEVRALAESLGWRHFTDLGDIAGARASEAILPLWLRLWMTGGTPLVNLHVVRGA